MDLKDEKYGFVYIWRDKKHKRFYIGAHWGREDDGYICSSKWMKDSYQRRPQDFKRRILKRIFISKKETFIVEGKWLQLIKLHELSKKYYNLIRNSSWIDNNKKSIVSQKLKGNKNSIGSNWWTNGVKNIRAKECPGENWKRGRILSWYPRIGQIHSEEAKLKMSLKKKGKCGKKRSENTKLLLSKQAKQSQKGIRWWTNGINNIRAKKCPKEGWYLGRILLWDPRTGKVHSQEAKNKMREIKIKQTNY
jgi:hypothetical protein